MLAHKKKSVFKTCFHTIIFLRLVYTQEIVFLRLVYINSRKIILRLVYTQEIVFLRLVYGKEIEFLRLVFSFLNKIVPLYTYILFTFAD